MKRIIGGVVVSAVLLTAGVAVACDGPWMMGPSTGRSAGQHGGANPAAVKAFQKETLALRDDLASKQVDLAVEYDKAEPNGPRIAAIQQEIIDLQAKIDAAAVKHGVSQWGWGRGGGMMSGGRGGCGCW